MMIRYFPEQIPDYEKILRQANIKWSVETIKLEYSLNELSPKTGREGELHRSLKMAASKWFPDPEFEYGFFDVSSKNKGIAVQVGDHWGSKLLAEITEIPGYFTELWWLSYPDMNWIFTLTKFYLKEFYEKIIEDAKKNLPEINKNERYFTDSSIATP